jgi:uncharacterized membrane protein YbhN (UPF0104 family)
MGFSINRPKNDVMLTRCRIDGAGECQTVYGVFNDVQHNKRVLMDQSPAGSMRGLYRSLIGYGIVLGFVGLCIHYVVEHREDFAFVAGLSASDMAAASLLVLVMYLINSYQLGLFLKSFGLEPGYGQMVAITTAMLLGNLVLPLRGGSGALAVYLKKVYKLDFQAFAAIYGGTAVLLALINTGLAAAGLAILAYVHGFVNPALTVVVVVLFGGSVYLSIFPPPVTSQRKGLFGPILDAARSWHVLARNRRLLGLQIATILAISLVVAGVFSFIYRGLGMPLPFSAVVITSSLGNVAGLVPLTPGGLGIVDAVLVQVPQIYGLDPARCLAAALTFRVLTLAWACALGIPGTLIALHASRSADAPHPIQGPVEEEVKQ